MTLRNLDRAFRPGSVAVVGASPRAGSVGRVVLDNIVAGGFSGAIYPVNLKYDVVLDRKCYRRIAELPEAPDLAVIMTPPETVPQLIGELGVRGTKAAVVLTAGISDSNGLRQRMLEAARPHLLRIIGPNTIGLMAPPLKLNASFAQLAPAAGTLGLISQSGAVVSSLIDWAVAEGIGFSQILSVGDMADVDVGDCLNMLAADGHTSAILMYLESIPDPRKFMSAARAAARIKPVIAVKPGRHAAAARAALTHTGAMAGIDRVVDAALHRAGIIRVDDLEELFEAAEVTARYRPLARARVAIITNGGGAGVLAVDQLLDQNCELSVIASDTIAALDGILPATWSRGNPVDIIGDAPPALYAETLRIVASDPGVDVVLVMQCPTALAPPRDAAEAVAAAAPGGKIKGKPVLACWLGKQMAEGARSVLQDAGIGSFDSPAEAARAVALLTHWSRLRDAIERVPPSHPDAPVDRDAVAAVLSDAKAEGRSLLTEPDSKKLIAAYGIPVPETVAVVSETDVADAARTMLRTSDAVVVKMLSKTISHKSDLGGVVLNVRTPEDAQAAAASIREHIAAAHGPGDLDGFTVQPMIRRRAAHELIAGLSVDPSFGPTILFGAGGTSVEIVGDTATGLVPLDDVLAGDLIDHTRIAKLLAGYRDRPPADRGSIVATLVALSQLAIDFPEISGIDINPLLADADGVVALDVRVEVDPRRSAPPLSIRPYPSGRESHLRIGPHDLLVRPIRPQDAALYPAFLARMDPEDMRLRFLVPMTTIPHDLLVRLTQLDYDRDFAFVVLQQPGGELCGIVRYSADPDRERAEFGILVRSDLKGLGLGTALLQTLIDQARREGIGSLDGAVLRENERMLVLCRDLGFTIAPDPADRTLVRATLALRTENSGDQPVPAVTPLSASAR